MSDFSGMEHSFALSSVTAELPAGLPEARERSYDVKLDEIAFRRLQGGDDLHAIHRLRAEIQLPGKALADPGFATR